MEHAKTALIALPRQPALSDKKARQSAAHAAEFTTQHERALGNQFLQRQLTMGNLQTKLTINQPGDAYEQEAERVAEQVMRMPGPSAHTPMLQRTCACGGVAGPDGECAACKAKRLGIQRKESSDSEPGIALQSVYEVIGGAGQPLDAGTRAFFEPRFGADFSHVRVHAGARAAESARDVNAMAYTVGQNIVFGSGQHEPNTSAGRKLLAHELSHVLQQQGTSTDTSSQLVQRAVECDELGNCQSVPDPEAGVSIEPPGDCTPGEHRTLQNEVNRACKKSRRCMPTDDCATILQKIEANAECIRARSVINSRCFRGGDDGHNEAVMAAVNALGNCWAVHSRNCRVSPPPIPMPIPETRRQPVVDKSFMDRMSELTGLTGAALVAYLIISEGSRLFPPRNLVPVP